MKGPMIADVRHRVAIGEGLPVFRGRAGGGFGGTKTPQDFGRRQAHETP